jgi:peroxin-14
MATVVGGVGFGLYVTAQRYILPLIKPPTPPQLTQDKESIDESFNKAFGLLEQLEIDTKALKDAEEARTTRLDTALTELETVVSSLKDSDRKREDDARRNTDEIRMLRDLIPKALESEKSATETRLKDLTGELKSLKTLMGNRMGGGGQATATSHRPTGSFGTGAVPTTNGASTIPRTATPPTSSTTPAPVENQAQASEASAVASAAQAAPAPSSSPKPSGSAHFPRFGSGKAAIPAWQMAAAKNAEIPKTDTSDSGTAAEEVVAQ